MATLNSSELAGHTSRQRLIAATARCARGRRRGFLAAAAVLAQWRAGVQSSAERGGSCFLGLREDAGLMQRPRHRKLPLIVRRIMPPPAEVAKRSAAVLERETASLDVKRPGSEQEGGGGNSDSDTLLNPTAGAAILLVLAALYGANTPLQKSVEASAPADFNGAELLSLRFLLALSTVFPWLVGNVGTAMHSLRPGVELGLWLWSGYTLQLLGLEKVSASTATVLFALCGLMVQTLECIFDRKPLSPPTLLSTFGALAGLGIFVTAPSEPSKEPGLVSVVTEKVRYALEWLIGANSKPPLHEALLQDVPGEALVLLGTFFFALHVWRSAALGVEGSAEEGDASRSRESATDENTRSLALASLQMLTAACLSVLFSCIDSAGTLEESLDVISHLDFNIWAQVAACGVLCTGVPHVLELFALRVTPAAQAALIYCTIPVWGVLLSVVILGEPLSLQAMLGGVLIVGCSVPWTSFETSDKTESGSSLGSTLEDVAPKAALGAAAVMATGALQLPAKEVIAARGAAASTQVATTAAQLTRAAPAVSSASQIGTQAATASQAAQVGSQVASQAAATASQAAQVGSQVASQAAATASQAASAVAAGAGNPAAEVAGKLAADAASTAAAAAASPAGQLAAEAASTAASTAASPVGQLAAEAASAAAGAAPLGQVAAEAAAAAAAAAASPAGQAAAEAAKAAAAAML